MDHLTAKSVPEPGHLSGATDRRILRQAARGADLDPGAVAWVEGPLRRFLERELPLAELPPALAAKVGLDETRVFYRPDWIRLGQFLAEAVAARRLAPHRALAITVPAAVGIADLFARQEANRLRPSRSEMAEARAALPAVTWKQESPWKVRADFRLGRFAFNLTFSEHLPGEWDLGWGPTRETDAMLQALRAGPGDGARKGTGLFPAVDRTLRAILVKFLDRYAPASVEIMGSDGKRNAHNAATYGDLMPDAYGLVLHRTEGDHPYASPDGVVGIAITRLPGIDPLPPVPLEPGTAYGAGGVPLPDVAEARAAMPSGTPSHGR